jgi:RND family efflux transporter MFP subunit
LLLVAMPVGWLVYWMKFSPVPVMADRLDRGMIVAEVFGTGTLEPHYKAVISPEISGRLREVLVDQGDRVESGQTLVLLDDDELTQQVAIAQAELESARAGLERARFELERAIAVEDRARRDENRVRSLFARNVSTQEELDRATEAIAIASAERSGAEAATSEAAKKILTAEARLEYQRRLLENTSIVAPADGLIIERQRDPGEVVVPGTPLMMMILTDELWVRAWVDETEMARLRVGQSARVVFRSEPGRSYPGSVARLGRQADRETREFIVDVLTLELPENWSVGQRADVYIETDRSSDVVTMPVTFLVRDGQETGAYVEADGVARWQPIDLGLQGRDLVEVSTGLDAGHTVIRPIDPEETLRVGRRVALP